MIPAKTDQLVAYEEMAITKTRQVFGELKEAVILSDTNRKITWVNQAFTDLLGYELSDIAGQRTQSLYDQMDGHSAQGVVRLNRASAPVKAKYVVNYRHKSGRMIRSETIGWAVRDDAGEVIGFAALVRDMDDVLNLHDVLARLYAISSCQSLSGREKIQEIMRTGCEYFHLPTALVSVVHGRRYSVLYSLSTVADIAPGTQFDLDDMFCGLTLASDAPLSVSDAKTSNFQAPSCWQERGQRSYIGIPLTVAGERIGTLSFSSPIARSGFSEEELDLIKLFAAWVAQEIGLNKAYEELNRAATTDWLTRAFTRRHFHPDVEEAFAEFTSSHRLASVVMLDIDHFKQINDSYGHATGDEVLHRVADALRDHMPLGARLYRVGGEEFALLITDCSAEETLMIAEQMRWAVDSLEFSHPTGPFSVSASLGTATLHAKVADAASWLYQADAALYASKNRGRNRVSSAGLDNVLDFFNRDRVGNANRRLPNSETGGA